MRLLPSLGSASVSWTATAALPGGDLPGGSFALFLEEVRARWPFLPDALAFRMARAYGTRMELILGDADDLGALGGAFGGDLTSAEVHYLREQEWAQTAEDVLWRRTKLGLRVSVPDVARLTQYLRETAVDTRKRGRL